MTTTEDQPFVDITIQMKEQLEADRCTLYFVDKEKNEVWSKVALGLEGMEIRLPTNRGVVGYVARTGRTLNLKDVYNDPRFDRSTDMRTGYRTKSMLAMAIRGQKNQIIGVLQALNKPAGVFTQEDEKIMQKYSHEVSSLIELRA